MSFLSTLRSVFGNEAEEAGYETLSEVFAYLLARINETDAAVQKKLIQKAQSARGASRAEVVLHAYFDLEHFIVSHAPPLVDNVYTELRLRQSIQSLVGEKPLPSEFRLVFMPPIEQLFEVCAIGIRHLADYLEERAGVNRVQQVLYEVIHGTPLEKIVANGSIDFKVMREVQTRTSTSIALAQYKQIYQVLFADISTSYGEAKAVELCKKDYEFFKARYDKNITAQFLSIVPQKVLALEQLAFMSREELERKISESTEELRVLNEQLERKVLERTQELKKNVDDLDAANQHLMELDQVKTEFISVAAHQLRTPLTGVKWMFSLLLDADASNLTDKQKDLISKGRESNDRMIKLVNDLLVVTNIESGKIRYNFSSVIIEDLIQNELQEFTGQAQAHHITLLFEPHAMPLPVVRADADQLRSVIQNLVENALNYSKDGGTISLSVKQEEGSLKVFVKDNGIGIPKDQQVGIFDKFFRADNAMSMRPNGSGLGLFMAKRIVGRHGGTIGFESNEEGGTTFYFSIPIVSEAKQAA